MTFNPNPLRFSVTATRAAGERFLNLSGTAPALFLYGDEPTTFEVQRAFRPIDGSALPAELWSIKDQNGFKTLPDPVLAVQGLRQVQVRFDGESLQATLRSEHTDEALLKAQTRAKERLRDLAKEDPCKLPELNRWLTQVAGLSGDALQSPSKRQYQAFLQQSEICLVVAWKQVSGTATSSGTTSLLLALNYEIAEDDCAGPRAATATAG